MGPESLHGRRGLVAVVVFAWCVAVSGQTIAPHDAAPERLVPEPLVERAPRLADDRDADPSGHDPSDAHEHGAPHPDGPDGDIQALAGVFPTGFLDEVLGDDFAGAVGVTLANDGRAFVWEKAGRVWTVEIDDENDSTPVTKTLLLDITEEVGNWVDHGLLGFAVDPDFYANGWIYLLYTVDHHHLTKFGTPEYDPQANEYNQDTIARVTRYTATSASGFKSVDLVSRKVLIGEELTVGLPVAGNSHGCGSLAFGSDGTLLVSFGDGYAAPTTKTAYQEGIITQAENVDRFRSQLIDSHAGKILRIDSHTGDGLPSNPFYDALSPRAPRSRVWALGLRNPFRFCVRPGTGSSDPASGDPGTLYVGDVGQAATEELNVVDAPGLNFGWPIFEGTNPQLPYGAVLTLNLTASNPLYTLEIPNVGLCTKRYFDFQDLIVQDTLNQPSWPNPCDPMQQIGPGGVTTFVHERPRLAYGQIPGTGAKLPVYDGNGEAAVQLVHPTAQVPGPLFHGDCIIGGGFILGSNFPADYSGDYLMGDYGTGFIKRVEVDPSDNVTAIYDFAQPVGRLVDLSMNPADGTLFYIDYLNTGAGRLHRVSFLGDNVPPTAVIDVDKSYGASPLTVNFDGTGSSDPEGTELSYAWDFGDGTPIVDLPRPVHVFPSEDVTAQGVIDTKLFLLDPPSAMGISNWDPETIRDGVFPPLGTTDFNLQYDTRHHVFPGPVSDKGPDDWIGYLFPAPRAFVEVIYQEGMMLANGGALHDLEIQVRDAQTGEWNTVENVTSMPEYTPDSGAFFETFHFTFPEVSGDGIRIFGAPSGTGEYFCIGELRVLARPPMGFQLTPVNQTVTLTVTDSLGATGQTTQDISLDNTPPVVTIDTPVNLSSYDTLAPERVAMAGTAWDAQHDVGELECSWQVVLHHEDHNHPETPVDACATQATLPVDGCLGDGDLHYAEVRYTVADPLGLQTTVSHWLLPDCDRNLNGWDDAQDIALGTSEDLDLDGVPDEAQLDCNNNGMTDLHELFFGYRPDVNGNGVPDDCEELLMGGEALLDPVSPSGPQ